MWTDMFSLYLQRCWLLATTYTCNAITKNNKFYSAFQSNGSLFSKGGLQISSESLVPKSPPHLDIDVLVRRLHRSWSKIWVERKESWLSHGVCCPDFLGYWGCRPLIPLMFAGWDPVIHLRILYWRTWISN